jgi:GNAT superfamily N-acetyltransferase
MGVELHEAALEDLEECGRIVYEAFTQLDERHGFPRDFASVHEAVELMRPLLEHPLIFGVLAREGGRVVGCNFLDERDPIRGVGPTTIDPAAQGRGVGRLLMDAVLERCDGVAGVRLTQDAYNVVSLALYASLGFEVKEPLVLVEGEPQDGSLAGVDVRAATSEDLDACAELTRSRLSHERRGELGDAISAEAAFVATRGPRIVAYTSGLSMFGHAVAISERDLRALVLGASALAPGPVGLLVPTRRAATLRWCLDQRLRLLKPMVLMARGDYRTPRGPWLPSAIY